jgi:hypothetical protein
MSLLHDCVDAFIIRDHVCWNAIVLLRGSVVNDEEAHVKLRWVGMAWSRYQSESASGVKGILLAGDVSCFEVVNF